MDIPLYILGLLRRFGPRHGYQVNKLVVEQIADFVRIKLPTVYYHLDRLAAGGAIEARPGTDSGGAEKTVYAITPQGDERFARNLTALLGFRYEPAFDGDALFYFADSVDPAALGDALARHAGAMDAAVAVLNEHEAAASGAVPAESRPWAAILFDHHRRRYRPRRSGRVDRWSRWSGWPAGTRRS